MPDLPTLTVTAPQATRLLAAFGTTAAYRAWLKTALLDEVQRREVRRLDEEANAAKVAALQSLADALPAPDPTP